MSEKKKSKEVQASAQRRVVGRFPGIYEKLFDKFGKELEKKDLIANKGSIVDASFVEV